MNEEIRRENRQPASSDRKDTGRGGALRELRSEDLLQGAPEILIHHGNDHYRLRSTSKGKLILTK